MTSNASGPRPPPLRSSCRCRFVITPLHLHNRRGEGHGRGAGEPTLTGRGSCACGAHSDRCIHRRLARAWPGSLSPGPRVDTRVHSEVLGEALVCSPPLSPPRGFPLPWHEHACSSPCCGGPLGRSGRAPGDPRVGSVFGTFLLAALRECPPASPQASLGCVLVGFGWGVCRPLAAAWGKLDFVAPTTRGRELDSLSPSES